MNPDHYAKPGALFGSMLTWKLKHGSHEFPGPDGGTCINEAAIVAAGFPYRSVQSADDCPPCFSHPISSYTIALNDIMPMSARQKLIMPFVLRLAGTADTEIVETQREAYISEATKTLILPIAFPGLEFGLEVSLHDAVKFLIDVCAKNRKYLHAHHLDQARAVLHTGVNALSGAAHVAHAVGRCANQPMRAYRMAVQILETAIVLGKHEPLEPITAECRMTEIRQQMAEQRKNKRKQLADAAA